MKKLSAKLRCLFMAMMMLVCLVGCSSGEDATSAYSGETKTMISGEATTDEAGEPEGTTIGQESSTKEPEGSTQATEGTTKKQETTKKSELKVHFLDVEQGLSVLVQCDGKTLIYDGGDRNKSSFVVSYLKKQGISKIDYMVSSHYDADHLAGLVGCLNAFEVKNLICSDYEHDSKLYDSFISTAEGLGLAFNHPKVGTTYSLGGATITILSPKKITSDSNENSVAIKITHGSNSFVITGDAEFENEADMVASGLDLECDVLCLGHHGSATATSWDFLQATVPEYAVISCGDGNSYGHPHKDVTDKLEAMEIEVYRTDKQGTIIATSDKSKITWNMKPCNDYTPGDKDDKGTQPETTTKAPETTTKAPETTTKAPEKTTKAPDQSASDPLVWISETGSKYHSINNCGRMNPNKATQIHKSEAEARGLGRCSKCW